ncbi:MAG: UPF0753 protein [Nitrospirales bacterium]|nr:MAG: UPF0753 protein [Nitrospirales bacterium]
MAEVREIEQSRDGQRMEVLSLVKLAGEPISHYWPMQTFIHHNPLHGLEHLSFDEAIKEGTRFLGGKGYLPNTEYRSYHHQGRITVDAIDEALKDRIGNQLIAIGNRKISHLEVLRAILINGSGYTASDVASALLQEHHDDKDVKTLIERLHVLSQAKPPTFSFNDHAASERKELASAYILSAWCDQTLGTTVQDLTNYELIKWCGGFLDEGHAPWSMPFREETFYGGWKALVQRDRSGSMLGIAQWQSKVQHLPDRPEDAIIECLEAMAIPRELWIDYFTMHFAQLSGWAGFIKWRSEQLDYQWQNANRIDLVKYLAVRLFYEKELVALACQDKLGIPGTYPSIQSYLESHPSGYGLYKEWKLTGLPEEIVEDLGLSNFVQYPLPITELDQHAVRISETWQSIRREQDIHQKAFIALHLAKSLDFSVNELIESPHETLAGLLEWVSQFPELDHGPIWLKAFELSFIKGFLPEFAPNLEKLAKIDESEEEPAESRPLAQGIFCIDVRSEGFRRHFEEVGGNETFGFAGFFGVPLSYLGFGSELETDQCPVLLKPKHVIKEIPRAYQAKAAKQFLERQQLARTGHTLLHDLKENVITPYIMVEAIGWFFGFRLFGQTLSPLWFKRITSWFSERFDIPLGTTLTVDKLTAQEAEEMVASEHRASIYRMLIERCGRPGMAVSHDEVERLRKQALNQMAFDPGEDEELLSRLQWTEPDYMQFIEDLRSQYGVHDRAVTNRMHRITQTGFTTTEQALFVETALRAIGSTKTFSRLILACAHGSISDNNPFESALDCGACGGNHGVSNARTFAAMANKAQVRQILAQKGIHIPPDTHFLPGQHDTTTDEVELFDLEDVPATHRKDLLRLQHDLEEATRRNSRERLTRLPDDKGCESLDEAAERTKQRSIDWSQVRPEWGLSGHTAFIVGRRLLTQGINLEGRTFLHSYDYSQDETGKYLEIIMTAPMIVGNWINMEHYFSTVDPMVYGAGSKVYHNVVSRIGVMYGSQSDICVGLPTQTVLDGDKPYHEPMRLFVIIEAPRERISMIIARHDILQRLIGNQWINLVALDPASREFFIHDSRNDWQRIQ